MEEAMLLDIRDLTIHYHTDDAVIHAVEHLNLTIPQGKTLGLVGETGAGKTTTAKGIMKLHRCPPTRYVGGEIFFAGEDILKKSEREMRAIRGNRISMIFQDPMTSLNPVMTVGAQIAEVIRLHQTKSKKEALEQTAVMLETVGIERDRIDDYPHQFSGGMKQRVVIAMALACNPQLLIADEPTTALDVTIQAQVLELMKGLKEQYKSSMLMITHDLGIVAEICDYVAIMYAGGIVEYGTRERIFHNGLHPYTKGLFSCIPSLDSDDEALTPIHGMMPDPSKPLPGCAFCPRCPYATERCAAEKPPRVEIEPGHFITCHAVANELGSEKEAVHGGETD